tara:strand:- start:18821 stop:18934 length:114 start_codon:yes stop_codon:yes gene_type:complete
MELLKCLIIAGGVMLKKVFTRLDYVRSVGLSMENLKR